MKTRETTPGKTYSVHTSSGCTVSDKNGWSKTIDAPDGYFTAHSGEVTIDGDDAADVREVFKLAPYQKLRLLGVVGGNASGLPAGYKRVEYIEFAGKQNLTFNKVFGLGFVQTAVMMITQKPTSRVLMHSTDNEWWAVQSNLNIDCAMRNVAQGSVGEKCNIVYELLENRTQSLTVNGTKGVYTTDHGNFPTGNEIRSFQINTGVYSSPANFYARLYKLNISCPRHGVNMKMIPCLDETGAPCMFDTVGKQPFYNQGTGDFLYPTDSTTYSLRRVLPDWGKLTENGLRRLYHAPANYTGELYDYALENGYKPIVETEQPEDGYWAPRWTETADEIVLKWVETEPPMEEPLTETE